MKNKSLTGHYQQILGDTGPWVVSEVRLDVAGLVNEVRLSVKSGAVSAATAVDAAPVASAAQTASKLNPRLNGFMIMQSSA